jgi:hypothetical protein
MGTYTRALRVDWVEIPTGRLDREFAVFGSRLKDLQRELFARGKFDRFRTQRMEPSGGSQSGKIRWRIQSHHRDAPIGDPPWAARSRQKKGP